MSDTNFSHEFVTEAQWDQISKLLERLSSELRRRGRRRPGDRQCLEGIVRRVLSDKPWCKKQNREASATACHNRLKEWEKHGRWRRIWRAYVTTMNIQQVRAVITAVLSGNMVPAWPRQSQS